MPGSEEPPRKLRRTLEKLAKEGERVQLVYPALLERHCDRNTLALARLGGNVRISSWVVVTDKNLHFVRAGILWDSVQSIPLERITDIEYVDEFHTNTIKIRVGELSENLVFYDELEGIRFYQYMKFERWKDTSTSSHIASSTH
ncbi:MAG: hypothetical protein N3G75_04115 [Methanothrix sp.]|nr:hypothetical protein [Methanothrix sp.]MCX8207000.1 hypothetical protein [Methanothrix sp.]